MSNQTTIQNADSIRVGSAKIEIKTGASTYVDLGAMRDIALKGLEQSLDIVFDNAKGFTKYADGDKFQISFKLAEINWDNIKLLKDGMITVSGSGSKTVEFNTSGKLVGKDIRITNTDSTGKTLVFNLTDCTMTNPLELNFIKDEDADVMTLPCELTGYIDTIVDGQDTV